MLRSLRDAVLLDERLLQSAPIGALSNEALLQEISTLEALRDNANHVNEEAMLAAIADNAAEDRPEVYGLHEVYEASRVVSAATLALLEVRLNLCKSERERRRLPVSLCDARRRRRGD